MQGTYVKGPQCGTFNASDPSGRNTTACPDRGFDQWVRRTDNVHIACAVPTPAQLQAIIPAAVHVHSSRNVRFENCTFHRLGASGLAFDRGSQNCTGEAKLLSDFVWSHQVDAANCSVVIAIRRHLWQWYSNRHDR